MACAELPRAMACRAVQVTAFQRSLGEMNRQHGGVNVDLAMPGQPELVGAERVPDQLRTRQPGADERGPDLADDGFQRTLPGGWQAGRPDFGAPFRRPVSPYFRVVTGVPRPNHRRSGLAASEPTELDVLDSLGSARRPRKHAQIRQALLFQVMDVSANALTRRRE